MAGYDVSAILRYLKYEGVKPVYTPSLPGVGDDHDIGIRFDERRVDIRDARPAGMTASLDQQGFALLGGLDIAIDSDHFAEQQHVYEQAVLEAVQSVTGATSGWVFDHTLRSDSAAVRSARSIREPAGFVHNDYTDASADKRLRELVAQHRYPYRPQQRFAIVNAWRPLHHPALRSPLACCDATTLAPADLVATERRARERVGELELVTWSARHRWYYFSALRPDELLLIKTHDSKPAGGARCAVHSAFDNPLAPADAPPRQSLESRLLLVFE